MVLFYKILMVNSVSNVLCILVPSLILIFQTTHIYEFKILQVSILTYNCICIINETITIALI